MADTMSQINPDCSGAAEAGLKWLRRANFGTAIPRSRSDGHDVHPLQQLKTVYDPKIRYSTFQYTITPELAKRLPIPGGYYDQGAIYNCIPDGRVESRSIYTLKDEGDTRRHAMSFTTMSTHAISIIA